MIVPFGNNLPSTISSRFQDVISINLGTSNVFKDIRYLRKEHVGLKEGRLVSTYVTLLP